MPEAHCREVLNLEKDSKYFPFLKKEESLAKRPEWTSDDKLVQKDADKKRAKDLRQFRELLAVGLVPDAVETLSELLSDKDARTRLGAVKLVFEFAYGRPFQQIEAAVNVTTTGNPEELHARILAITVGGSETNS